MKVKIGPATVAVERGDITNLEVDAIVNAANTTLAMSTGVAAAIKRKGGVLIEEEAMSQGPIEVGEAVLTPGGNLAATHVIHVAVMGPDLKTDPETIARATRSVLAVADKHRLTSLALPALGTGRRSGGRPGRRRGLDRRAPCPPQGRQDDPQARGLRAVPG